VEVCCWLFSRRENGWSWVVEEEVELNHFSKKRECGWSWVVELMAILSFQNVF
jgi:hypothetical protein